MMDSLYYNHSDIQSLIQEETPHCRNHYKTERGPHIITTENPLVNTDTKI